MSRRWTLKEDFIVCKYCAENRWAFSSDVDMDILTDLLVQAGFTDRTRVAITARARDYELLIGAQGRHRANEQMQTTYSNYVEFYRNPECRNRIKSYIKEVYNPNEADIIDSSMPNLSAPSSLGYVHTLDFNESFPMVLQKYLDKKGITKYKPVYDAIYMKQDTFSSILRGKYKEVKKENVLRLCIGLKLDLVEAEDFMASAGYMFSRSIMTDVVIKSCIMNHCYDPFIIDEELQENKTKVLFSLD